jgi:NADH-quinone oxidoreductase subunit C
MSASADALAKLKVKFTQVTDRASRDCPAADVPTADIFAALKWLRDDAGFDLLSDVTAIDWAEGAAPRFTVVYHLYSTTTHAAIRVATPCTGDDAAPAVPSVVALWPGANWHEREAFDMFGIKFEGHPDLRRILMWDGYPYHPLRKEFPLAGIETALPDIEVAEETKAKVIAAPMAGGPFVASAGEMNLTEAEPRAKDESWNERAEKPEA